MIANPGNYAYTVADSLVRATSFRRHLRGCRNLACTFRTICRSQCSVRTGPLPLLSDAARWITTRELRSSRYSCAELVLSTISKDY